MPDTIAILRGLKERYEVHHGVRISDDAIVAAAMLSDRYISDRFLPDKAIDLIDEAASRLKIEIDSMPMEIDEVQRRIIQLEIEQAALEKETAQTAVDRREAIAEELANLQEQLDGMKAEWEAEKDAIQRVQSLKATIEETRAEAERAQRDQDLQRAAELTYGDLPKLEAELDAAMERLAELQSDSPMLKEEVGSEDVAEVVGELDGHPRLAAARGRDGEARPDGVAPPRARHRPGRGRGVPCRTRSGGRAPAWAIPTGRSARSSSSGRPASGRPSWRRRSPSSCSTPRRRWCAIDMSEYMEKHTVSRLIGAPPGYVGYDEGGQLTEAVRRRPYSVLLLDEIEKAHTDVFNVLLQLLDDGRLTDGQGRTVDFRNTIVIMTSNATDLEATFRPEFLNRIDEIVHFERLDRDQLGEIVRLQVEGLRRRLAERGIALELTDAATELLIEHGYDPAYGARPLKRTIQRELENPLAIKVLSGELGDGAVVRADALDGELVLDAGEPAPVAS